VAVAGDRRLLERLVANLIENGVRHNACEGGWVVASLSLVDGRARLVVENSGETMSADTAERLFEPFQRLERGHGARGAGLGLSIVRSVAEAHGGSVALAPRGDGGLAVRVELPGARPARGRSAAALATGNPSHART
jgi:signal transduction histidine kinase